MAVQFLTAFIGIGVLFALLAGAWYLGGGAAGCCGARAGGCVGRAMGRCPYEEEETHDGPAGARAGH